MARILWTGLLLACAVIVLLVIQNRSLASKVRQAESKLVLPYQGMWVPRGPEIEAPDQRIVLGAPEKFAQLVLFFSAECLHCQQNADELEVMFSTVKRNFGPHVERVAIAITQFGAKNFIESNRIDASLGFIDDHRITYLYRADTVPAVLVIDRNGQVEFSHVGIISSDSHIHEIMAALQRLREANQQSASKEDL